MVGGGGAEEDRAWLLQSAHYTYNEIFLETLERDTFCYSIKTFILLKMATGPLYIVCNKFQKGFLDIVRINIPNLKAEKKWESSKGDSIANDGGLKAQT